jgi:hypothetical protein
LKEEKKEKSRKLSAIEWQKKEKGGGRAGDNSSPILLPSVKDSFFNVRGGVGGVRTLQ